MGLHQCGVWRWVCRALLCVAAAMAGCDDGPDNMAEVSGKVTLDGQPLSGARVTFTPVGAGSSSSGVTDSDGHYELSLSRDIEGAVIGEHTVSVTTYAPANPDGDPPSPGAPEKVPTKFNRNSTLTKKVEDGSNEINLELDSQGEIIPGDRDVDQ